jgi:hypothetical protein
VLVEDLGDEEKRFGLTKESIQTDVELKLRLAGIRVLPNPEPPGFALVFVRATVSPSGVAATVKVSLKQLVRMVRNPAIATLATTWDESETIGRPSKL